MNVFWPLIDFTFSFKPPKSVTNGLKLNSRTNCGLLCQHVTNWGENMDPVIMFCVPMCKYFISWLKLVWSWVKEIDFNFVFEWIFLKILYTVYTFHEQEETLGGKLYVIYQSKCTEYTLEPNSLDNSLTWWKAWFLWTVKSLFLFGMLLLRSYPLPPDHNASPPVQCNLRPLIIRNIFAKVFHWYTHYAPK